VALAEGSDLGPDLSGEVIEGRYQLVAQLGGGTFGVVYRAEDLAGGEPVAIKLWHQAGMDPQAAGRFHRETKALDTLDHPNIVAIRDYGLSAGQLYLVTELLQGMPLETLVVEHGALPPALALSIAEQMLSALAFAHERQVVHRDLKPDNVFLTPRPGGGYTVKLLDYGLAKFLEPQHDPIAGQALTKRGTLVGTPLYMAPEQALGRAIDKRTDVYAVGCLLFEMLAGQPPFMAESLTDLLRAHLSQEVPRLVSLRPDLPDAPALQAVVDRALAKQADDRFADAGHMLAALKPLMTAPARGAAPKSPLSAGPPRAQIAVPAALQSAPHAQSSGSSPAMLLFALATALCAAAWWFMR
jgi:eukaryotic-like serine/threonine-protein kinase